ncbi:hypothetical protein UCREL1_65 [Eutypa lata UCREL1]|uniref:Uncharacterized protein n=1 Tax=Eutypa lata (strain UCR-EL1) TaxID=1287681 RepID=M7T7I8_EUTLA|nr:hypothetical protein UCREL1_65 [Eutypa lata UCREL1]
MTPIAITATALFAALAMGDGSYLAAFDSNGVSTIEFTPFNEALGDITCSGRAGYIPDIDAANVQAAKNAEAHGYYNAKAWGWVFVGGEVSFFCNGGANTLKYSDLISFQTAVSGACGQGGYGYDICGSPCGVNDLGVGRTFRGDHFCTKSFTGL